MKRGGIKVQHSVTLIKDKCKGCTKCIKQCPTEAIRVRHGKAIIIDKRCIDCGQCIRVCPYNAKKAVHDSLERLNDFSYTIALPAPSLYGQFKNLDNINQILASFLKIGFDHVYEVSMGAEMLSNFMRLNIVDTPTDAPLISSACPAVVRLICMRFSKLIDNIVPYIAPMEIAAICAREEAMKRTGLLSEEIGIFFITPCPAKITEIHSPSFLNHPVIDGAFSIADIYRKLLHNMQRKNLPNLLKSKSAGIGWALAGGEISATAMQDSMAVAGIEHVIAVLENVEDRLLTDVQFLELNACNQGCVGGCLTVENPYVAKVRIKKLLKKMQTTNEELPTDEQLPYSHISPERFLSDKSLVENSIWQLAENRIVAMMRYQKINALKELLPGLDCGTCGTPSCRALAEDVVLGFASEDDCIFRVRERMQEMAETKDPDEYLPPPFRKSQEVVELDPHS